MRSVTEWAATARTVFDCSELGFRSLAELEQYASGLVHASQVEILALAGAPALPTLYTIYEALQSRQQIARYLATSAVCDFGAADNLVRVVTKVQFIARILATKLELLQDRISTVSLAQFAGNRKPLVSPNLCDASFLDEVTGELSQFQKEDGNFWRVSTFGAQGLVATTRIMSIMDPAMFDKGAQNS